MAKGLHRESCERVQEEKEGAASAASQKEEEQCNIEDKEKGAATAATDKEGQLTRPLRGPSTLRLAEERSGSYLSCS